MSYQTQREKIKNFFMEKVYPAMDFLGVDYQKTISKIASEIGSSESMVEDVLRSIVQTGKIKEIRSLELPEQEVEDRKKKKLEQIQAEMKSVGLEETDGKKH
jgi:predicted transcriptional regulator